MANTVALPFRADHVGSPLRTPELLRARAEHEAGRISAEELRGVENAAIRDAARMQEEIGLEGVTDGEVAAAPGTWISVARSLGVTRTARKETQIKKTILRKS